jgi:sec-independent protein translocase protein TatC
LFLALIGLVVGVVLTLIPPVHLGQRVLTKMEDPARIALDKYYEDDARRRIAEAKKAEEKAPPVEVEFPADQWVEQLKKIAPELPLPAPESVKGRAIKMTMGSDKGGQIRLIRDLESRKNAIITLGPLEGITMLLMVCMITGLVISSPWVFYQAWAFVAAGLYRHERHYVLKFLPFSLGLFLSGVLLCFFAVLPATLGFLLEINAWLEIEPNLRLSEWMSFATILPLVFGLCFQTPLIMLFLERIGLLSAKIYREKRKFAILIMVVVAAVLTPGPDVFSQFMLAVPMIALYEIGILLVGDRRPRAAGHA